MVSKLILWQFAYVHAGETIEFLAIFCSVCFGLLFVKQSLNWLQVESRIIANNRIEECSRIYFCVLLRLFEEKSFVKFPLISFYKLN